MKSFQGDKHIASKNRDFNPERFLGSRGERRRLLAKIFRADVFEPDRMTVVLEGEAADFGA